MAELHPVQQDFRKFMYLVWKTLNLPDPTPVQYDIANFIQNSPKRAVIEAFRGVGKSWITSAFVCWTLLNDPVRHLYNFIYYRLASRLQKISDYAFRHFPTAR